LRAKNVVEVRIFVVLYNSINIKINIKPDKLIHQTTSICVVMAEQGTTWGILCLSALSAGSAEATTYPLDFIKTRLQLHQARVPQPLITTVAAVVRQEGFRAMYAGISAAILRHMPYTSIRVSTFESLRNWAQRRKVNGPSGVQHKQIPLPFLSVFGMFSGALGQAAAVPADLVKIRLQSCTLKKKPGMLATFQQIIRQEGILGLWRGSTPAIQRAALVNLGELTTYDVAKRKLIESGLVSGGGKDTLAVHISSSMCSGLISAVVSTPADVVKTRLMSQDPLKPQYKGMIHCCQKTFEKEGVRGLYKGFLPTWARLGPWQLTFWVTFEKLRKLQGIETF
jgi:solute carrier family 25 (mitochondrial uncoupling protein), member 27